MADDRIYSFSFSKSEKAKTELKAKPKRPKVKNVAVSAVDPAPRPLPSPHLVEIPSPVVPPPVPVLIPAVTNTVHVPASENIISQARGLEVSALAADIVDRRTKRRGPMLNGKYLVMRDLLVDAEVWSAEQADASVGLAYKFELKGALAGLSPRLVGGVQSSPGLTSPGRGLHPYYGVEAAYSVTSQIFGVGQFRLQDDSRYGAIGLGLGIRL